MHVLTPLHVVLLSANLFLSMLVVLLNCLALGYFEVARHMNDSNTVYVSTADFQQAPTSQTESRDYILIIIGVISTIVCVVMLLADLRQACCGCFKRRKQQGQKLVPVVVEMSAGIIILVWWVAMITYILTSYDGFPKCSLVGPKDITRRVYNGCYLMDGALGAGKNDSCCE